MKENEVHQLSLEDTHASFDDMMRTQAASAESSESSRANIRERGTATFVWSTSIISAIDTENGNGDGDATDNSDEGESNWQSYIMPRSSGTMQPHTQTDTEQSQSFSQASSATETEESRSPRSEHSQQKEAVRKGKWTPEEEAYTSRIIRDFNTGILPLFPGTTLRSYLSDKLNCDPMRITKKFAGAACIGKRVFAPCKKTQENIALMVASAQELAVLEEQFWDRVNANRPLRYKPRSSTFSGPIALSSSTNIPYSPTQSHEQKLMSIPAELHYSELTLNEENMFSKENRSVNCGMNTTCSTSSSPHFVNSTEESILEILHGSMNDSVKEEYVCRAQSYPPTASTVSSFERTYDTNGKKIHNDLHYLPRDNLQSVHMSGILSYPLKTKDELSLPMYNNYRGLSNDKFNCLSGSFARNNKAEYYWPTGSNDQGGMKEFYPMKQLSNGKDEFSSSVNMNGIDEKKEIYCPINRHQQRNKDDLSGTVDFSQRYQCMPPRVFSSWNESTTRDRCNSSFEYTSNGGCKRSIIEKPDFPMIHPLNRPCDFQKQQLNSVSSSYHRRKSFTMPTVSKISDSDAGSLLLGFFQSVQLEKKGSYQDFHPLSASKRSASMPVLTSVVNESYDQQHREEMSPIYPLVTLHCSRSQDSEPPSSAYRPIKRQKSVESFLNSKSDG